MLHYFSCTLDRAPPYDLDPQPASFSIDDDDILALTSRLIKYKGFVLTREEHDAERCFVSAARVKWEDARDDDAMEE